MIKAVADTHTIIWWIFANPNLSLTARTLIQDTESERNQVGISSISLAEIIYLTEKGRVTSETFKQVLDLMDMADPIWLELPFERKVAEAMRSIDRRKIPDLHHRMIAATALERGVPLLSRDAKIQVSGITTIW